MTTLIIRKQFFCETDVCVCNLHINSQIINVCHWHLHRKYLMEAPELHKTIPARKPCVTRERKMRTKFFCTKFLNTPRGPGHPGKIPGTSQIPLFETQGRQTFEGGHEVFGHHPLRVEDRHPTGRSPDPKS